MTTQGLVNICDDVTTLVLQTDPQVHMGLGAQGLVTALENHGIDPTKMGLIVHDEVTDKYALRKGELIAVLIKAIQQQDDRIDALEADLVTAQTAFINLRNRVIALEAFH